MVRKYRGACCVSRVVPPDGVNRCYLQVQMHPADIHFFTNVIEAYEHLALVTPVAPREGVAALHYTPDMEEEILAIIVNFPRPVKVILRQ